MPSCVFRDCKNCSQKLKKDDGVSFHRFPSDPVLRDGWISIIRVSREDNNWLPSKFCVVCSAHFKEEDVYFTKKGRRLIKKIAKPIQKLSESQPTSPRCQVDSEIPGPYKEDNPIGNDDSDLDSIFDTPRESRLRTKLRKYNLFKTVTNRKLKSLQGKVRRLEKRNSSLKNILKQIKEKFFINSDTHNLLRDNLVATELFNLYMKKSSKIELKYSPAVRKFCLTLNFYSPKGYEYVRKAFNSCLPHPKTLAKWYTHVKSKPGFTREAFVAL